MNFAEMDIAHLITLWSASGGRPEIKSALEAEFQNRIPNNVNFTREDFFDLSKVKNHSINVEFIPSSESYNLYGSNVTIDALYTDEEMVEMITNWRGKPVVRTSGKVRFKTIAEPKLTAQQLGTAEAVGFNTSDVFAISHI